MTRTFALRNGRVSASVLLVGAALLEAPRPTTIPAAAAIAPSGYRSGTNETASEGIDASPTMVSWVLRPSQAPVTVGFHPTASSLNPARAGHRRAATLQGQHLPERLFFPALSWTLPRYEFAAPDSGAAAGPETIAFPDLENSAAALLKPRGEVASLSKGLDGDHGKTPVLGVGADALRFDDRPGHLSTAAGAGEWNGQAATAVGMGYTLANGLAHLDAAGVVNTPNVLTDPRPLALPKSFALSAVASIPLR